MGGWQDTGAGTSPLFGVPAAGVILGSAGGIATLPTATLTNDGSIGALSDRAVASSPLFPSNNTSIINNRLITGFVDLVGGNNSIVNNGTFDLRHFADTTGLTDSGGNGVRDTVRVAVADLGTGPGNTFTNNGTLALAKLDTPATTLDSTGRYLPVANVPAGNPHNEMALGGPLQGQIIGVQTFTNSGVIDLQSNPAPGDVMMITGGRGGSAPGPDGGGTFISNGGVLKLDTVLNQGGSATLSDTLVV
jgi:autotransporter family porin